jgi:hypothetical protein
MPRKTPDELYSLNYKCNPDLQAQVKVLRIVYELEVPEKTQKIEKAG